MIHFKLLTCLISCFVEGLQQLHKFKRAILVVYIIFSGFTAKDHFQSHVYFVQLTSSPDITCSDHVGHNVASQVIWIIVEDVEKLVGLRLEVGFCNLILFSSSCGFHLLAFILSFRQDVKKLENYTDNWLHWKYTGVDFELQVPSFYFSLNVRYREKDKLFICILCKW